MNSVWLLWFVHNRDAEGEDELLLGVYRTEQDAKAAIDRLATKRGFVDEPSGFEICEYELNKDHWTEGFIVDGGCTLPSWMKKAEGEHPAKS
jgi:hypothetical protein